MDFGIKSGHIEIICGSMFSGKSEELIRRLRRAIIAKQRVQIFKPALDTRFENDQIVSHSEQKIPARVVKDSSEILAAIDDRVEVIGIDEVQFFDPRIVDVCNKLANMGKRVIVAGLDQDYRGVPFEPVPQLMAIAEYITKTLAVCARCGAPANRTQRIIASEERIVVGAASTYEARCRRCFEPELTKQLTFDLEKSSP
ncbi:MAG: thymidine kinase [Deltaproteobacteria bacterium]|nr:thymidine kinase [Deltaproteobacteria bacterium]